MPPTFGPYSVDPDRVAALTSANFGQFVSRLLATEVAAYQMAGGTLATTYVENTPDGGVDASLQSAAGTRWIPAGHSAWQFKARNLGPTACKAEIGKATHALQILRDGGKYRIVFAATMPPRAVADRRKAIMEELATQGITTAAGDVEVLIADNVARWAEEFPALAVNPLIGGTGQFGLTFDQWSRSSGHTTSWFSSAARDAQIDEVRQIINGRVSQDVHLDGDSGLGKTRLVMEAARGQEWEPILLYVPAADDFPVSSLTHIQGQGRSGVVVVDECSARRHKSYADALTTNSPIRLVTIGEPDTGTVHTGIVRLDGLEDEAMAKLLEANQPQLWPEATRVVVSLANGNVDYALKAAKVVIERGARSVGGLITEEDVRRFITDELPGGTLFLAAAALALFTRVGFYGDVASDLSTIATGLGISEADLRSAAADLARKRLLSKQGRYRAVGPNPLALYLASQGWETFGQRIITSLLPGLNEDLTERLFHRAADLGDQTSSTGVADVILAADGPLASLSFIAFGRTSRLLRHFAVIAPTPVAERLSELLANATEGEILALGTTRRDLVGALQKLAWHSRTFEVAADTLLRLAQVETENYSNNSNGIWVELFGAFLPGTAASPEDRIAYLKRAAKSSIGHVRGLAVKAAHRALEPNETIVSSGELQGGLVVERRGLPATWGDLFQYRHEAIDILCGLAADEDLEIAHDALNALLDAIHPTLEIFPVRDHLAAALASLGTDAIIRTRLELSGLKRLFDRVDLDEGDARPESLKAFEAFLPPEGPADALRNLLETDPWDYSDVSAVFIEKLVGSARAVDRTDPTNVLLDQLEGGKVPSSFAAGSAVAQLSPEDPQVAERLRRLLDGPNLDAAIGFFHSLAEGGCSNAYDDFVDSSGADDTLKLHLTVRGPRTDRADERVSELGRVVSVQQAARYMFGWLRDADEHRIAEQLANWLDRIVDQADYNAAVDMVALYLFRKKDPVPTLEPLIQRLVGLRANYPQVANEEWDWAQLAGRQLSSDPVGLTTMLADLIHQDAMSGFAHGQGGELLQNAVAQGGEEAWLVLMTRIEAGEWRFSIALNEWIGNAVPVEIASGWVGSNVERARLLASVVNVGAGVLSDQARHLIDNFGTDAKVASALSSSYGTGMWSGPMSQHLATQITQVQSWIDDGAASASVRAWGRKLIANLEHQRFAAVEREAEGDW